MPNDLCQCSHWGVLTKGRIKVRTKQGDETHEATQTFCGAPGHAPEALEVSECVEFSPTKELHEALDRVKAQSG
ncbi:hypothetical protein AB0C81_01575 [Streptomyces roseoverticillatus]|uniref:hypothetical protein n=1 Tax=Streptomyces roseoverticillatus TaxID=66429 RepID=UPI00340539FE